MNVQPPLHRVPIVIFAVLIGGLFVYAKGGGQLFSGARPKLTPASASGEKDPSGARVEFMMGSKSAPAFRTVGSAQPTPQAAAKPTPVQTAAPSRVHLFPGSKSAGVIGPADLQTNTAQQQPAGNQGRRP